MKTEPTQSEREVVEAIRDELRRRLDGIGGPTRKELFNQIGLHPSTFDTAFRRGSIKLVVILRILGALDIDPGEFFTTALVPDVTRLLGKPKGEPPLAVRIGLKRIEEEGWP